jgi:hypothetical protein
MSSMVIGTGTFPVRTLAERLVSRPRRPMAEVAVVGVTTCACGQALECCHAAHCPRCGVTLHD